MGKLVDMAYTAAEKKKRNEPSKECYPSGGSDYPYGLTISLTDEHIEKLGLDKLPKVGKTITLTAKCEVTSVSQSASKRGDDNRRVELQITKMALDSEPASMEDAVDDAIDDATDD